MTIPEQNVSIFSSKNLFVCSALELRNQTEMSSLTKWKMTSHSQVQQVII